LVPDDAIVAAMRSLMIYLKLFVEPSGAAALAGVLSKQVPLTEGQRIAVIVSGGNIDLERLKCMV
jgi:threonine dehydratase